MYHCFVLTSVMFSPVAPASRYSATLRATEPLEQREHGAVQNQIHDPQERAEHDREEDHHDGRGVHLTPRRPRDALQLVADFDEKHARAVPPPADVLARFSKVVAYHVARHLPRRSTLSRKPAVLARSAHPRSLA